MASNLRAMGSSLRTMASSLRAMASNLLAMTSDGLQPKSNGLQPTSEGLQPKKVHERQCLLREGVKQCELEAQTVLTVYLASPCITNIKMVQHQPACVLVLFLCCTCLSEPVSSFAVFTIYRIAISLLSWGRLCRTITFLLSVWSLDVLGTLSLTVA